MFKKLLLLGCFLSMMTSSKAQTLAPGDIAIIGTNYDVIPYEMTIVNLAPIAANTVIRITDYGYDETTGTFGTTSVSNTSEGSITWTTTALAAGTVTKLTISGGATPVVTGLPGTVTVTGWSNATATNCPVPAGGDNWFIFQGNSPTSITNFIFAWTNTFSATFNAVNQPAGQFNVSGSGSPNNNNSYLPPSLTLGSTAIALNRDPSNGGYHGDNNVYTGIFIGTKAEILSEIGNVSKWTRSETLDFNITPGAIGSSFPGANPIFTLPNSTPTDIALSATAINENVAAGSTVGILSSVDADIANTFTYTLVAGAGDTDNAAFTISGANLQINASPNFEAKSIYAIRVRTADQGGLSFEKTFTININNVNEVPTDIALSATTINENVAAGSTVGIFSSVDADAANTFTYTLVAGAGDTDNTAFNISGSNLRITASPNFEAKSSYSVRIRTTDQGGLTYDKAFTITITNVNEAPTDIALSATAINENVAAGSTVGILSSVDADAANTFTYSLVAGAGDTDNTAFNISGSNLRITASPNFEAKSSYSVRIRTTDQGGLTYDEAFTITITNVNEAPTDIALSATAINENVAAGSTVGILSSIDADAANTFTYTLVAGAGDTDNAAFNISGSNLRITASPNFETKSSYSVRVRTADQGGLTYEKAFTITITNVNEAPTDIALSATAINENVAAGSTVGILSSVDADAVNTFTYTLVAGAGDTDNAAFNISGSNLRITASPNFEVKSSYSVRIRTTDQGGQTYDKAFTITITNVNEAPSDITLSAAAINENVPANTVVGTLSSTDPDATNTFAYTLVAGAGDTDNAAFNISGTNLRISASPDFETKSSYLIRIRTTDQGGLSYEKAFTISVNDLCELNNAVTQTAGILTANQAGASYQWIQCPATILVGENGQSYTPTATGSYAVVITIGSCSTLSSCILVSSLANPDFENKSKFVMYPNPSSGIVNIQCDYDGDLNIINQLGQTIKTVKVSSDVVNTINIENYAEGIYFVNEKRGSKVITHKLILKK